MGEGALAIREAFAFANPRCHYCNELLTQLGTSEALQRPDTVATRDHIEPKCDGGIECVLACHQCNQIKGCDPYDVFQTFMDHGGRDFRRHERKARYRWFRGQIMAIGLVTFREERDRLVDAGLKEFRDG